MISIDAKDLFSTLTNTVSYTNGFLEGVKANKINFNRQLGQLTLEALYKYIDAKARGNPQALHHVYEWNRVGSENDRLFDINFTATSDRIVFSGSFLPSKSISESSSEPFVDKANIMENRIAIEVEPKNGEVLAFDIDGETIFTTKSIYISHPGGDQVANSFGSTVDDFFGVYFVNTFLRQTGIFDDLSSPKEFIARWGKKSTRNAGIIAGKRYLSIKGEIE